MEEEKKEKNPVGRPSKMTPEVVILLKEGATLDATVSEICLLAGISRETYYEWMKKDKGLSDTLNMLRNSPVLAARKTLLKAVHEDPKYALEYVKRKRKKEFSERVESIEAESHAALDIIQGNEKDTSDEGTVEGSPVADTEPVSDQGSSRVEDGSDEAEQGPTGSVEQSVEENLNSEG